MESPNRFVLSGIKIGIIYACVSFTFWAVRRVLRFDWSGIYLVLFNTHLELSRGVTWSQWVIALGDMFCIAQASCGVWKVGVMLGGSTPKNRSEPLRDWTSLSESKSVYPRFLYTLRTWRYHLDIHCNSRRCLLYDQTEARDTSPKLHRGGGLAPLLP